MSLACKFIDSPVGRLKLVAGETALVAILWENDDPRRVVLDDHREHRRHPILVETERQLKEYFKGSRRDFSIPLDMRGTPFQKSVWKELLTIPFGETRSYSQLARQVGRPRAWRAVGTANGRNPLSIVVPCHRAIAASGKLAGFAGGLDAKVWLLEVESQNRPDPRPRALRIQLPTDDKSAVRPRTRST